MIFSLDQETPRDILRIKEPGYNVSCGYYSENCWVDEDRLVVSIHRNIPGEPFTGGADLILADTAKQTETVLYHEDGVRDVAHVVHGKTLYYVENGTLLCAVDVDMGERREIHRSDGEIVFPHMTADGRYLNWAARNDARQDVCKRIDLTTGEVVTMLEKSFAPPFNVANHMMLCPTDPDLLFFAHEGDTRYVSNRLWLRRLGEEPHNIARQRLGENGELIDCFGHESWAADGKGLYFVKYVVSPSSPKGVCYVDAATREAKVLFSKFGYWHVCAAPDGRHLAADTGPGCNCSVILIDMQTGTETELARVRANPQHPGHPHPQFSPACTKVCFHTVVDKDTVTVGIVRI